jgi:hypothetical protein
MKVEPVPDPAKHPVPLIESRIYLIRGQKVLLDGDLAVLFQVTTGNLNKAVQRNRGRFPQDFMFQLTREEDEALRFQFGISNESPRRTTLSALCLHGAGHRHAVLRSPE